MQLYKLLELLKKIGWTCILMALPVWMSVRSLMPSETPLEYFEKISQKTPKFETRVDGYEVTRHLVRLDDTTTTVIPFWHDFKLANPDPQQYFLVYKEDSLGNQVNLGVVRELAPLTGGRYTIYSYQLSNDTLLFSKRLIAEHQDV